MAKWLSTPEGQECKQKADSLIERFGPEIDKIGKECRELFSDGAYVYSYDIRAGRLPAPVHCETRNEDMIYTKLKTFEFKHGESMLPVLQVQDKFGQYTGVVGTYYHVAANSERTKYCNKEAESVARSEFRREKLATRMASLKAKFGFGDKSVSKETEEEFS